MTTANLGLTLPTVGADSDTWGNELNTDLGLIDTFAGNIGATIVSGLTLSTAGSSATFGIAAGLGGDSSGALMVLASAYTKTTGSWAVGTGNGSLDTGSIANTTWYHVWLIKRVDTGVVDVVTSLSATALTMPTNYTLKRRIGAMLTNGSAQWRAFTQISNKFIWASPSLDFNSTFSVAQGLVLTVPTGVIVEALVRANTNSAVLNSAFLLNSILETPTGPTSGNYTNIHAVVNEGFCQTLQVFTNTSAQVRIGVSGTDVVAAAIGTYGWIDPRGQW